MSYTVNEVLGIIDNLEDSFDPIYTLTKSGGTTNTEIAGVETTILTFNTYEKEYPLLAAIHQIKLNMDSEKPAVLYRDIFSALNSTLSGLNTWLTTNTSRVSVLEALMLTACSITIGSANIFPDANQLLFTMNGSTLAAPTGLGLVESTGGNLLATTYYVKVTAINDTGETVGSTEESEPVSLNASIDASWSAVSGATGYKVYVYTTTAEEKYLATVTTGVTYNIKDNGAGSTVPTVNTAHTVTDGIALDMDETGAAKTVYKVTTQGSSELRMTVYYKDEDDAAQTENITIAASAPPDTEIAMTAEVADITKIAILSAYPGTATDSGAFRTKADR